MKYVRRKGWLENKCRGKDESSKNTFLLICFQKDATSHSSFISGKLLNMFRVISPPITRSTHNCIYSIWYLSNLYCYLPLSWKSWNAFPTLPRQRQVALFTVADTVNTVVCAPDDGWRYHPKHVGQFSRNR